jgi:hypothetical protein
MFLFLDVNNLYKINNDKISMLGIKYIVDGDGLLATNPQYVSGISNPNTPRESILGKQSFTLKGIDGVSYDIWQAPVDLKPNSYYAITLDVDAIGDATPAVFFCDFFGDNGAYDSSAQQAMLQLDDYTDESTFYLFTDDVVPPKDTIVRLGLVSTDDVQVQSFAIDRILVTEKEYPLIFPSESTDGINGIYENPDVKDVLYSVPHTKLLDDLQYYYENSFQYDCTDTSYILKGEPHDYADGSVDIQIESYTQNGISANVSCQQDTFLNFSQSYFPGWQVYIDGKQKEVLMVNGVIMGVEVPKGVHKVTFQFFHYSFWIGAFVTLITSLFCILYFNKDRISAFQRRKKLL